MLLPIVILYQNNLAFLSIISWQHIIVRCKSTNKILKSIIKQENDFNIPPLSLTLFNQNYAFRVTIQFTI